MSICRAEVFDTMLAQHLRFPDFQHDLEFVGSQFCSKPAWKAGVSESFERYCARDVDVTFQCYQALEPLLKEAKLLDLHNLVSVPLGMICRGMNRQGFAVDPSRISEVRKRLLEEGARLEISLPEWLRTHQVPKNHREHAPPGTRSVKTGKPVKFVMVEGTEEVVPWRSTAKKLKFLYGKEEGCLGLERQFDPKTGSVTTGKIALDKLAKRVKTPEQRAAIVALKRLNALDEILTTFCKEDMLKIQKMHPHFNVHGTASGRLSSSDPNCFDGLTEVLTPQGWVPFRLLSEDTEVMQWEAGKLSFTKPTRHIKTTAPLVSLVNEHIDLAVTDDHRCLLRNRKTGALHVRVAAAYPEDFQQIHSGIYESTEPEWLSDDLLTLICALQADAHWEGHSADFVFCKKRKIERLEHCLQNLKLSYRKGAKGVAATRFRVHSCRELAYCNGLLGGDGKHFGRWLLGLSPRQMDLFLEEIHHWDGCFTRQNHYSSNEEANADWVQTIYVLRGQRANKRSYQAKRSVNFQVDATSRDFSLTTNIQRGTLPAQEVFCVSVPSSYLLVRRNGKTCITGNCQNIPEAARCIYVPSHPGWEIMDVDYSQLENRLVAFFAGDHERLARFDKDPDFSEHKFAASQFFNIPYNEVVKDNDKDAPYGKAKRIVHGTGYGMGPQKIVNLYDMDLKETKRLQSIWKDAIRESTRWQNRTAEQAKENGFLCTPFGRKRWFWTSSYYTESLSFLPQSSGADIVFRAMIGLMYQRIGWPEEKVKRVVQVYEAIPEGVDLLLQVHDSLVFQYRPELRDELARIVTKVMTQGWQELGGFSIPIGIKVGPSWGDCETYKGAVA